MQSSLLKTWGHGDGCGYGSGFGFGFNDGYGDCDDYGYGDCEAFGYSLSLGDGNGDDFGDTANIMPLGAGKSVTR